jgi:hypothetical protein
MTTRRPGAVPASEADGHPEKPRPALGIPLRPAYSMQSDL